ncbi:unnamed protein product [Blepharisma stoltei]|uniref:ENTH domain-containing protein n=1 Tax=Blepharisma stoltei TaxID=1481888 RepID=A0AAU9JIW3_9CILI|nr:unnamed protein product [Blepharisma stoltei]
MERFKKAATNLKHKLTKTPLEKLISEVTKNNDSVPSKSSLYSIADKSFNTEEVPVISKAIWHYLKAPEKDWKKISKTLTLIETLIKVGSNYILSDIQTNQARVRALLEFSYREKGLEQGDVVRTKVRQIVHLLSNEQFLQEERAAGRIQRERFMSISSKEVGSHQNPPQVMKYEEPISNYNYEPPQTKIIEKNPAPVQNEPWYEQAKISPAAVNRQPESKQEPTEAPESFKDIFNQRPKVDIFQEKPKQEFQEKPKQDIFKGIQVKDQKRKINQEAQEFPPISQNNGITNGSSQSKPDFFKGTQLKQKPNQHSHSVTNLPNSKSLANGFAAEPVTPTPSTQELLADLFTTDIPKPVLQQSMPSFNSSYPSNSYNPFDEASATQQTKAAPAYSDPFDSVSIEPSYSVYPKQNPQVPAQNLYYPQNQFYNNPIPNPQFTAQNPYMQAQNFQNPYPTPNSFAYNSPQGTFNQFNPRTNGFSNGNSFQPQPFMNGNIQGPQNLQTEKRPISHSNLEASLMNLDGLSISLSGNQTLMSVNNIEL